MKKGTYGEKDRDMGSMLLVSPGNKLEKHSYFVGFLACLRLRATQDSAGMRVAYLKLPLHAPGTPQIYQVSHLQRQQLLCICACLFLCGYVSTATYYSGSV